MTGGATGRDGPDTVDHGPTRLGLATAVLAGVGTAGGAGWYSTDALLVAGAGLVVLLGSLVTYRRGGLVVGALGLFAGVAVAGTAGAPVPVVIGGVAGAAVAWDAGDNALSLGAQAGLRSRSVRSESVHLAGTLAVVGLTASASYGVFRVATGGQPVTALVLLLLAGALLAAALSE